MPKKPVATYFYREFFATRDLFLPINWQQSTMVSTLEDPVLNHFRATVAKTYGDRLERVILYGSRARGDAQPDSDYDIAVFLHDVNDLNTRWTEMDRLADISTALLEETGEFVHAMAYRAGSYNERTPLMHEIRREGIDL